MSCAEVVSFMARSLPSQSPAVGGCVVRPDGSRRIERLGGRPSHVGCRSVLTDEVMRDAGQLPLPVPDEAAVVTVVDEGGPGVERAPPHHVLVELADAEVVVVADTLR